MEEPGYTHPLGHTLSVDLGPRFDLRWKGASLRERRELLAELHGIYREFDENDLPAYAPLRPRLDPLPVEAPPPSPPNETRQAAAGPELLPKNLLSRLLRGQVLAEARLRELMEAPPTPPEAEPADPADLERELRLRMGPLIDTLIEEHLAGLKAELRFRLRAELDSLISAVVQKP